MTTTSQPGILAPLPSVGLFVTWNMRPSATPLTALCALRSLAEIAHARKIVVGLGSSTIEALGGSVEGFRAFPTIEKAGVLVPSTPASLWTWLHGEDRGELTQASIALTDILGADFEVLETVDAYLHRGGRDLTGYVDGTENPSGDAAQQVAIGSDGGSYVAVQRWVHDLSHFASLSRAEGDNVFGRRLDDNEELDDAPASAHVKRTAQEDFEPEAFLVRRSMPWSSGTECGLMFVAFGHSLAAFEAQLRRMVGLDDGVVDALFSFTQPRTGAYFWCPPMKKSVLDLSAAGIT